MVTTPLLPGTVERLNGEVATFAASARVIQLHIAGGGERQVSLAPNATVRRADGAAASPADLRPGLRIQVAGQPGAAGALVADEVVLLDPR